MQAAHTVLRLPHEPLAQWALSKKGKRHKNIIVHMLGRKLVEIMYKVSLRGQPYEQQGVSDGQEVQ